MKYTTNQCDFLSFKVLFEPISFSKLLNSCLSLSNVRIGSELEMGVRVLPEMLESEKIIKIS